MARRTPTPEQADLIAWLGTQTWSNFATSLFHGATRYGTLTPNQERSALKMRASCAARAAAKKAEGPAAPAPAVGFYFAEGEWYRVQANKDGSRVYAKRWAQPKHEGGDHHVFDAPVTTFRDARGRVHEHPTHADDEYIPIAEPTWVWVYEGKKPFAILTPEALVGIEQAAAFGHEFGRCLNCNAELTDPDSVARGMGPTCAKRFTTGADGTKKARAYAPPMRSHSYQGIHGRVAVPDSEVA